MADQRHIAARVDSPQGGFFDAVQVHDGFHFHAVADHHALKTHFLPQKTGEDFL